ncbi:MAG: hypothetical protein PHE41_02985, partial [Eubacteriales bacterium]|nr:hypothetical protein [Eubacteriales bacterium]
MRSNMRILNRILLIFLTLIISIPSGTENIFSFAGGGTVVMKTFEQMTEDEKERALRYLIDVEKTVPNTVKVDGKTYSLNLTLWRTKGLIVYGNTSAVNALVQVTNSPNYKDGQWRYWGFDMNGGLYGNDDFPPDVSGGTSPQNKNWLTTMEIRSNSTASDYVGSFAMIANSRFSNSDKLATATAFLSRNPAWRRAGLDENYIIGHFYYNCVLSDSGLTRGQFVGVHKSAFDGNYYYQTFEVKGGTVKFVIPDPKEDPLPPPDPEEPVIPPPEPEPEYDISVNCALGLPAVTYTGHPALAEDRSVFLVDGEAYSARRTYEEGLASNVFSTTYSSGSVRRISKTQAEVKFSQPGNFQVELAVTPRGGVKKTDTKSIEVKKTPTILHTLTGTQKQNRKQVLNLQVAKHPESSLTDFWVKLDRLDTEETVTLHHKPGVEANTFSNSETIKTRPIERLSTSDMYFENCRLEFLLKNDVAADCRYTVYVKDSRGNTDQVSVDFSVASDKPPEAEILLESYYVRKPDSNNAQIIVEDGTKTDGDQVERTWYYQKQGDVKWTPITSMVGYADLSVGTGKIVGFLKEGVGAFQIKLDVKDLWSEETLPEYVTEDERKTGSVTASADVINVAPVVSLTPLSSKTADIIILT